MWSWNNTKLQVRQIFIKISPNFKHKNKPVYKNKAKASNRKTQKLEPKPVINVLKKQFLHISIKPTKKKRIDEPIQLR